MRGTTMHRLMSAIILASSLFPSARAAEPGKGEFLQDYITCESWMKREATDAEMHAAIGRWMVDALRQQSPGRLPRLSDAAILDEVERHCDAQPGHRLSVAIFLSGHRLSD